MKDRGRQDWLRERLRRRAARETTPTAPARKRRVSRREREARRRRLLFIGMAAAGSLVVLILAYAAINDYFIKPRHVVASVEGTEIRRRDYWKVRSYDLINQASQYQQFAAFSQGQQQTQYQALAQQAITELDDVWGSTSIDDTTLSRMVEDQVYLKSMEELGVEVTEEDIDNYILQQFEPSTAPIFTPTPTATFIPARADWATQTAQAELTPTPGLGTPDAAPGTPTGSPAAGTQTAAASPVGSPEGSPAATPAGSPAATPVAEATPDQAEAIQTAESGYEDYKDAVFGETHMSQSDYERLVARPAVARQKISAILESDVGQTAEQVHASHILVGTQDLANSIYDQVTEQGANFEQIAREQSTDSSTAPNGGDLGWFTRGAMVDEFEQIAFSLQPGELSEPFQTEFGWHIVKVYAHEQDRPLTEEQIGRVKESVVQDWVEEQQAELDISSELDPTPTPESEQFVPPPDAPPLPTPASEALPVASPAASPDVGPVPSPVASPSA
ncbi:MAG: peptidylprolyl isomerase [Thermomicrobiales bacterium]